MTCHICEKDFDRRDLYWSCCGAPVDGSSGSGCKHDDDDDDNLPTCGPCGADLGWWDHDNA